MMDEAVADEATNKDDQVDTDVATDMDETAVNAGEVPITLLDKDYVMYPSLNALQVISRRANGLRGAMAAVGQYDVDVICLIVELGLGQKVIREDFKNGSLAEAIFQSGLSDSTGSIISKCMRYLTVLMTRGGRPAKSETNGASAHPRKTS